jgi:aspartyl protease family protein
MDGDMMVRITYLGLIVAAVGGALIAQNRHQMGKLAQTAAVWGLIFVGVVAGYGLWSDMNWQMLPRQTVLAETGQLVLPRAADGHFYATLKVDGVPLHFVVDTGATDLVLSRADAGRLGIDTAQLVYGGRASTANGTVSTAQVWLKDVTLGKVTLHDVRASVNGGRMDMSLLGMTFLNRLSKVEMSGNRMILTP